MPPLTSLLGRATSGSAVHGNRDLRPMSTPQRGGAGLDLKVIDDAYGDFADLYSDVLRVSVVATQEHIQLAYFDRRSELFTLLARLDSKRDSNEEEDSAEKRQRLEGKMDAVVFAVRILGDTELRLQYDQIRQQRLMNRRRAAQGQLPGHEPQGSRGGAALDSVPVEDSKGKKAKAKMSRKSKRKEETRTTREATPPPPPPPPPPPVVEESPGKKEKRRPLGLGRRSQKKKEEARRRVESRGSETSYTSYEGDTHDELTLDPSKETYDTEQMTDGDDSFDDSRRQRADTDEDRQDTEAQDVDEGCGGGCLTASPEKDGKKGVFSCITNSRVLRNLTDELSGACEDTLMSVDQVFNAFTLTDKDIRAVTRRIDRAKRQLDS